VAAELAHHGEAGVFGEGLDGVADVIMMCDIYSSIIGRRNAGRQVAIDDINYILRTFVMDGLILMTRMNINLTEYNYAPGNYGTLTGPSNINIII
jgi:hypothetical protein